VILLGNGCKILLGLGDVDSEMRCLEGMGGTSGENE
jgi:hypothetical protein